MRSYLTVGALKPFFIMAIDSFPIPTIEMIFNGNSNNTCEKDKKNNKLNPNE
jgi:hypothetical protein